MEDQIAVTRKLVETYSFMDKTRTGIWGWSYGGFATLMTLEQDVAPDPVFSCGISGAIFCHGHSSTAYCPLICYSVIPLIRSLCPQFFFIFFLEKLTSQCKFNCGFFQKVSSVLYPC
jgi:hypothetical protein